MSTPKNRSSDAEEFVGGPCQSCLPGSVSLEWNCPQCGGTGIDPTEPTEDDSCPEAQ